VTFVRAFAAAFLVLWSVGLYMQGLGMGTKDKFRYIFHVIAVGLCTAGFLLVMR
jgi:hypothetical protein